MIYCVVPEPLADELYDRLDDYYADDPNVTVIVDRRKKERRDAGLDRRRPARGPRPPARRASPASSRRSPPASSPGVKVVVHVDGGARGNPGPAAAAAVLVDARTARCSTRPP